MRDDPKPIPAGRFRYIPACTCGRRIPEREGIALYAPPPCPECGGFTRVFERVPIGFFARIRHWWQLRQWKKRRQTLYERNSL